MLTQIDCVLHFNDTNGYIGQPYWAEKNTEINIMKLVHPKLGDTKKAAAIRAACEKNGIDPEKFSELQAAASRPFYTVDGNRDSEIIVPQRVFQSFLNHASMEAPKAVPKIDAKGLTFIGVKVSNGYFTTGKTVKDAQKFERFVKLEESNQRTFSTSLHIPNADATGVIELDEEVITADNLFKLVEWGGRWIGIGSARPQGYGRFTITRWNVR